VPRSNYWKVAASGGIYDSVAAAPAEFWTADLSFDDGGVGDTDISDTLRNACATSCLNAWKTFVAGPTFTTFVDLTKVKVSHFDATGKSPRNPGTATQANRATSGTGPNPLPAQISYVVSLRGSIAHDRHQRGRVFLAGPSAGQFGTSAVYWSGGTAAVSGLVVVAAACATAISTMVAAAGHTVTITWAIASVTGNWTIHTVELAKKPGVQRRRIRSVQNVYTQITPTLAGEQQDIPVASTTAAVSAT
jgi:hypothetical protein